VHHAQHGHRVNPDYAVSDLTGTGCADRAGRVAPSSDDWGDRVEAITPPETLEFTRMEPQEQFSAADIRYMCQIRRDTHYEDT
jgi:hypothetical protein